MTFINHLRGYSYIYSKEAKRDLKKLSSKIIEKVDEKMKALVSGNQGLDIKKLTTSNPNKYRIRVGNYRIIYRIYDDKVLVVVITAGHRKHIYNK